MTSKQLKMTADQWLSVPFVLLLFLLPLVSHATPINRQVGISENVFITVQNDTYGNEQRVCSIDAVTYVDGDSIPTSSPCEHCICRPPGFACTIISCEYRPGCKALKRSNQCCPEYKCECEKDGKIYQNGEKILDNNNPCEVCYCQGGDVICAVIDCFWRSDCQPRYIENRCCPLYDHCPPPADVGPTRPTRPTMPTTTPVEGTSLSWFNLSSTVSEVTSPATTTTTSTTTTSTTTTAATTTAATTTAAPTTTVKATEPTTVASSAAPVILEESSKLSEPVSAIADETVPSQVTSISDNNIDQQPPSQEKNETELSPPAGVDTASSIQPSESVTVIESTTLINVKPILLTIDPTSVGQVAIVSPTETPAMSTTTASATQGLEESTSEPAAEPEPENNVVSDNVTPTEALSNVITALVTETISASTVIPDIEPTAVNDNEIISTSSSQPGISVEPSAAASTETIQSDPVTEEYVQQDSVQTTIPPKEEAEALHVEPEVTTASPSVSVDGIVQDEEVRPIDSVSEQSIPATTEDVSASQDESKVEIPASVILPPSRPEDVINEQEIQVNDSPANDKIEIHAFAQHEVPSQNLQPPKLESEIISHDDSPVPTTELPVEKIQDDEQNDEVAIPTTEAAVNDEPAVTVAQDQSVVDTDVQVQDSPVVQEETVRATDSPSSQDISVSSLTEEKEAADMPVTTEQPNIESEEKHEILADESPATAASVATMAGATNSPIIFVVAPGQDEFYVSVPHNSEPVKLEDALVPETEQTTQTLETVPQSDSAANLVDDDTFEIVPENDRPQPSVPVIQSQIKEDQKSQVVEEIKENVPVQIVQDEPVVTTIRTEVKGEKEEETGGKDGDEDTIEVASLDNNSAPILADETFAATTLPTEIVKSQNQEQVVEMEKKPIEELQEEQLSDGVVEVLSGVTEASTDANIIQEEHTRHADETHSLADQAVEVNAEDKLSDSDIVRNTENPTVSLISENNHQQLSDDVVTTHSPQESLEDEQQFQNDEAHSFDEPQTTVATEIKTNDEKVVENIQNQNIMVDKISENGDILADENVVPTTVDPRDSMPSKIVQDDDSHVHFDEVVTTVIPNTIPAIVEPLNDIVSDQAVEITNPNSPVVEEELLSDQAVEIDSPQIVDKLKETVSDQAIEIHNPLLVEEPKEILSDQAVEIHNVHTEEEKNVFDETVTTVQPELNQIRDEPVMNKVQKVAAVLASSSKIPEPEVSKEPEMMGDQPIESESATVRTKLNEIAGDSSESKFRLDMSIFDDSVEEEVVKKDEKPVLKAKTPIKENEIKKNVDDTKKIDNSEINVLAVDGIKSPDMPVAEKIKSHNVPVVEIIKPQDVPVAEEVKSHDVPVVEEIKTQDVPAVVETTNRPVLQTVDGVSNNDEILIFDEGQVTATQIPPIQSLHLEKQSPVAEVQAHNVEVQESAQNVLAEEKKVNNEVADEPEHIPTTEAYQKLSRDDIDFSDEVAEVTTVAAEASKATKNAEKNLIPSNSVTKTDKIEEIIVPLADESNNEVSDVTTIRQSSELRDSIVNEVEASVVSEKENEIAKAESVTVETLNDEPGRTTTSSLLRHQIEGDETTIGNILQDEVKEESIQTTAANVRNQEADEEVHFDDVATPTEKIVAEEHQQNLNDFVDVTTTKYSRFAAEYHDDAVQTTDLPIANVRKGFTAERSNVESVTPEMNDETAFQTPVETTLAPAEGKREEIVPADESPSTDNSNQILSDDSVDTTVDPVASVNHDEPQEIQTSEEIVTTMASVKNESVVKTASSNVHQTIGENVAIPRISEDMRSDIGSLVAELSLKSRMTHEVAQVEEPWLWRTYNRIRNLDFFPKLTRQPREAGEEPKKETSKSTYTKTKKATQELPKEIKKQVKLPSRSFLLW